MGQDIKEYLRFYFLIILLLCIGMAIQVQAESPTEEEHQHTAFNSIVGLIAEVPTSARTARFLGESRQGSGIVIGKDGLIVTINYLILEAEKVTILDLDGKEVPAAIVGYDANTGFGVVRALLPLNATPIAVGNASPLSSFDRATVVSFEEEASQQREVWIAARKTFIGYWEYLLEDAIFTVPAMRSYAGAALVDENGILVGVGSLIVRDHFAYQGNAIPTNMFVPTDQLQTIVKDLVQNGRPSGPARPWLGIQVSEQYGRVVVLRVNPQGPAARSGIEPGDIILEVNGHEIDGIHTLYTTIWNLGEAGVNVPLTLLQGHLVQHRNIVSQDRYQYYEMPHIY